MGCHTTLLEYIFSVIALYENRRKQVTECVCLQSLHKKYDFEPIDKTHSNSYALVHDGRGCQVGEFYKNGKEFYRGQGHDENNQWIGDYIDDEKSIPYYDSVHRYCWIHTDEATKTEAVCNE